MKNIKESIDWMLLNPNQKLTSSSYEVWFDGCQFKFKYRHYNRGESVVNQFKFLDKDEFNPEEELVESTEQVIKETEEGVNEILKDEKEIIDETLRRR